MNKALCVAIVAAGMMIGGARPAVAWEILIDLGPTTDTTTVDSQGRTWNKDAGLVGVYPLVNASNQATSVSLRRLLTFSATVSSGLASSDLLPWDGFVTSDSAFINTAAGWRTNRFEGLTPGAGYTLTVYGSRNTTGERVMQVKIGDEVRSYDSAMEGGVVFANVIADASGYISVAFDRRSGDTAAHVGGISLAPVSVELNREALIDFGPYSDTTNVDSFGRVWNKCNDAHARLTALRDVTGQESSVYLAIADAFSGVNTQGVAVSTNRPWDGFVTGDSVSLTSGTAQAVFEGLTPGAAYDLTFYGANVAGGTRYLSVTIGAAVQFYYAANEGATTFTNVAADATGAITANFNFSGTGYLSAVSLMPHTMQPDRQHTILVDVRGGLAGLLPDTHARYWNGFYATGNQAHFNLWDATGKSTPVDILLSGTYAGLGGVSGASAIVDWDEAVTGDNYWINSSQSFQIRITGIPPGQLCALMFYGRRNSGDIREMTVNVGGVSKSYNGGQPDGKVTFSRVEADADGGFTAVFTCTAGASGNLSGFQIDILPPPPGTLVTIL